MRSFPRFAVVVLACTTVLSSCATEIIGDLTTTVPAESTTTTIAAPTGDIEQLLEQLDTTIVGLGQKIVDADSSAYKQTYAEVLAIWEVL